jgi:hypothetical protein
MIGRRLLALVLLGLGGCRLPTASVAPAAGGAPAVEFTDVTAEAGIRFRHVTGALGRKWMPETMGSGCAFLDYDGDGWLDLFLVNGHVYPEVERIRTEAGYKQRKVVYRNLRNGRFEDITERLGEPVTTPKAGRGAAFGDLDNDGDVDVVVNNVHDAPDLFRLDTRAAGHWLLVRLIGTRSNRSAIGARLRLVTAAGVQHEEVRGGGSYYAQNDLRVHFGLGEATRVERLEVRWPSGLEEAWDDLAVDRLVTLTEGGGRALPRRAGAPTGRP